MEEKYWLKTIEKNKRQLDDAIKSIDFLKGEHWYNVKSNSPLLNEKQAKMWWELNAFHFEIGCVRIFNQKQIETLLNDRFVWMEFRNEARSFKADYYSFSNFNVSLSFQGYTTFKGSFRTIIESEESFTRQVNYTAVIKCPENNFLGSYYPAVQLKVGSVTYAARIIELTIEDQKFHIFLYGRQELQERFLFVENVTPSTYEKFVKILHELVLVLTYETGTFPGNDVFILKNILSKEDKADIISAFRYADKLVSSQYGTIPKLNDGVPEHSVLQVKFGLETLVGMIKRCMNQSSYRRTILLMIHANAQPDYIKVVSYAVALESMAKLIYEENKKDMKPIFDKTLFNEIRSKLKSIIDEYAPRIVNGEATKIKNYLDNFNKPSNAEMLTKPFEIYFIPLEDLDREAIKKRNDFLHGRLPFEPGSHELSIIAHRLQYCVNSLIMKYCGYKGGIIYQASLYQHYNNIKVDFPYTTRII